MSWEKVQSLVTQARRDVDAGFSDQVSIDNSSLSNAVGSSMDPREAGLLREVLSEPNLDPGTRASINSLLDATPATDQVARGWRDKLGDLKVAVGAAGGGALAGAVAGSVIPGAGTGVGACVGALAAGVGGIAYAFRDGPAD